MTLRASSSLLWMVTCGALAACSSGAVTPTMTTTLEPPMDDASLPQSMTCQHDDNFGRALDFERSPGGTLEVSAEYVAQHHCNLRIVDVREKPELVGKLGHVPGATWVPLRALARQSETWSKDDPIVLVDRSGRRSGRAASYLDAEGFKRVASLTGGMVMWEAKGLPISRDRDFGEAPKTERDIAHHEGPLTLEDIEIHIGDPKQVRWTKAATLLLHGTESCVDGRDDHAVIGTPGGDSGELLAGLATLERLTGRSLSPKEVLELFNHYVESFGHFYMHTDEHALRALGDALKPVPAFAEVHLGKIDHIEDLVRHPPTALQDALLPHLVNPAHIGCGHLRLISLHPDEYEVRAGLTAAFFEAFFRRLWKGDERLEYVVLEGEHEEGAVLNITLDREVHPYTEIPMVAPRHAGQEMFVNHPQVADFIRRQNASFLLEELPLLQGERVEEKAFIAALSTLAKKQLASTVRYLAAELPVFEVAFEKGSFTVREVR